MHLQSRGAADFGEYTVEEKGLTWVYLYSQPTAYSEVQHGPTCLASLSKERVAYKNRAGSGHDWVALPCAAIAWLLRVVVGKAVVV